MGKDYKESHQVFGIRICKQCGKKYPPYFEKQKFCCKSCWIKSKTLQRAEKTCPVCGKKFPARINTDGSFRPKTCGRVCGGKIRFKRFALSKEGKNHIPKYQTLSFGRSVVLYRAAAEKKLGRRLRKGEAVHHIDCNCENHSPDNLWIYSDNRKHLKGHGSLNRCVSKLMKLGVLSFKNGKYFVLED